MAFTLTINMDTDPFRDGFDGTYELAQIIEQVAGKMHDAMIYQERAIEPSGVCRDSNGNVVGEWKIA